MINPRSLPATFSRPIPNRAALESGAGEFRKVAWITLLHLPLGVLLYNAGPLAILHPIAAFLVGMRWAVRKDVPLARVAWVVAYISGSEVLWRMAQVPIFWEFGKYGSVLIIVTALARRHARKIPALPIVYFALLVPACILTFIQFDLGAAKGIISSNMSGPLLLAASACFFANINVTALQLRRLLLSFIIPLVCVACTTLFYTVTTPDIEFTTESNFATSGGFGPNQVSSVLGLGVFLSLACLMLFRNSTTFKIYFIFASVLLATQSLLTFSRGGMYNAAVGVFVLILLGSQNVSVAIKRLVPLAVLVVVFMIFLFPVLNDFTGGSLQERFEESGTSRRTNIASADFQIFLENPLLGVGVGGAYSYRERFLDYKAMSHTEFSRLIAEHGMFGVGVLLVFLLMTVTNFIRNRTSTVGRALAAGAASWSIMFMLNGATRLGAPSVIWALTFITVIGLGYRRRPAIQNTGESRGGIYQTSA